MNTDTLTRELARHGNTDAQVRLAASLISNAAPGPAGDPERQEAGAWLSMAATAGSIRARGLLGELLLMRDGGATQRAMGLALLREAAASGDVTAARNYGLALLHGDDPERADAEYWISFAAQSGDVTAQSLVA